MGNFHVSNAASQMQDTTVSETGNRRDSGMYGGIISESTVEGMMKRPLATGRRIGPERLGTTLCIADALREEAGLQVRDYGGVGGLKTLNIRSLGTEYTAVFVDGIQIDNAQNMQVDLGRFSADGLSSVEIHNGHRSLGLQPAREYASAGSVYLNSSVPVFRDGRKVNFTGRVKAGSSGTVSPSLNMDFRIGKASYVSMNAEFLTSNGRYRYHATKFISMPDGNVAGYDTTMTRRGGDITSGRAVLKAGGHGEHSAWDASAYYYESDRGLPGPVVRSAASLPGEGDRQEDRDIFIQGSYRYSSPGRMRPEWMFKGRFVRNRSRYFTDPVRNPQAMPVDVTYRQTSGYISASGKIEPSGWCSVNIAADAQYSALEGNPEHFARPVRFSFWGAAASDLHWDKIRLSASVVYSIAADKYDNTGAGAFSRENRTRNDLSPALMFRITPAGEDRGPAIEGFARKVFRMPSFNDLYYTTIGNAALRPETAAQYDLGLIWPMRFGRTGIEPRADIYCYRVRDKIVALPTSSQFRWTMFNIGRANTLGSDISMTLTNDALCGINTSLTAKYTWQKSVDRTDPGNSSYGGQIPYIPLHSGSITASAGYLGWRVALCPVFTGERWSSSANFTDYHLDRWTTFDATVSKELFPGHKSFRKSAGHEKDTLAAHNRLKLSIALRNLTGSRYQVVQGYPMPGFNVLFAAEYSF